VLIRLRLRCRLERRLAGPRIPPHRNGHFFRLNLGIPRHARGRYYQPYSLGDRSDAVYSSELSVRLCRSECDDGYKQLEELRSELVTVCDDIKALRRDRPTAVRFTRPSFYQLNVHVTVRHHLLHVATVLVARGSIAAALLRIMLSMLSTANKSGHAQQAQVHVPPRVLFPSGIRAAT